MKNFIDNIHTIRAMCEEFNCIPEFNRMKNYKSALLAVDNWLLSKYQGTYWAQKYETLEELIYATGNYALGRSETVVISIDA